MGNQFVLARTSNQCLQCVVERHFQLSAFGLLDPLQKQHFFHLQSASENLKKGAFWMVSPGGFLAVIFSALGWADPLG